jgi:hypothetical protein
MRQHYKYVASMAYGNFMLEPRFFFSSFGHQKCGKRVPHFIFLKFGFTLENKNLKTQF